MLMKDFGKKYQIYNAIIMKIVSESSKKYEIIHYKEKN